MIDWQSELQAIKARIAALEDMRIQCSYPLFAKRVRQNWLIGTAAAEQALTNRQQLLIRVAPEYPGAVVTYETAQPVGVASGAWFTADRRTAYAWTSNESTDQELLLVWRQALSFDCDELRMRFIARMSGAGAEVSLKKVYDTTGEDLNIVPVAATELAWTVKCIKAQGTFKKHGLVVLVWSLKSKNGASAYLADAELSAASFSLNESELW